MVGIKFLHLLSLMLWLGSVVTNMILESSLRKRGSREGQIALIELHTTIARVVETPAILTTLITGSFLLMDDPNPSGPLYLKILFAIVAASINLFGVKKVFDRDRWVQSIAAEAKPQELAQGQAFSRSILGTGIGIPFALAALYLAVSYL